MSEQTSNPHNFLGTQWRNIRNKHIYTVVDQPEAENATPFNFENQQLLLEVSAGSVGVQDYIPVRAGEIGKFFAPHRKITPIQHPDVDPVSDQQEENAEV